MKNVMGGLVPEDGGGTCASGESTWHCTVGTGYPAAYICQGPASSGGCGGASNCGVYCQRSNGTTYWA
jgi:hypothetical protein